MSTVQSIISPETRSSMLKIVSGQTVTVTAADTVVTPLRKVLYALATLDDAPTVTCDRAQAVVGNQAGAPAAGSLIVKTWSPTSNANPTPIAAATFGVKVNWIAVGY